MKGYLKFTALFVFIFFISCNQESKESMDVKLSELSVAADSTEPVSSSAAKETGDPERKFIRTADIKFKVKNVFQATNSIEDITKRQEGFVIYTNLASTTDNVTTTAISADSSLETTYFTVTNSIILRVSNTNLDTTLKEIAQHIDYLDYRVIKAEDVALQILSNSLANNRNANTGARLVNAIERRGKKLNETVNAEETLLYKNERSDNARVSNLSLMDQVKFSTVNILVYQRQDIKREVISNFKNMDAYEPSFGSKFLAAVKYGMRGLEAIVLFLTEIWEVLLLMAFIYLGYKTMRKFKV